MHISSLLDLFYVQFTFLSTPKYHYSQKFPELHLGAVFANQKRIAPRAIWRMVDNFGLCKSMQIYALSVRTTVFSSPFCAVSLGGETLLLRKKFQLPIPVN
jgi:hypothetical protein